MDVCGYININEHLGTIPVYAQNNQDAKIVNFLTDLSSFTELSLVENEAFVEIGNILIEYVKKDKKINLQSILKNGNYKYHSLNPNEQKNVLEYLKALIVQVNYIESLYDKKIEKEQYKIDELGNPVAEIPLLGTVKAGYDYLAQENWIGTVDIDKKLAESGELFALKIKGDSMSPVLIEDDIVIIKKQDDFESGDIVVAIINGDEATIKKGKKSENSILLQPLNTNYEPLIFTYDEMKSIPVTIVGIVKQLKREF